MRLTLAVVFVSMATAANVSAEIELGGAFVVSRLPAGTFVPGSFAMPPNGRTAGAVLSGGAIIAPRIVLQGELSIPARLTTLRESSHPGTTFVEETEHRDTILSGLLKLRAASWCEVLIGGGVDFERTEVSVTQITHFTGETTGPRRTMSSSAARAAFTTGVDFPLRVHRHFALVPTGRMHIIARAGEQPGLDTAPLSFPSRYTFRLGVGGRVEF